MSIIFNVLTVASYQSEIPARQNRNVLPSAIIDSFLEEGTMSHGNIETDQVGSSIKQASPASDSVETSSQLLLRLQELEVRLLERLSEWLKTLESKYHPQSRNILVAPHLQIYKFVDGSDCTISYKTEA